MHKNNTSIKESRPCEYCSFRVHDTDIWCQFAPMPSHVSSPPLKENDRIPVQISFNYAPRSPIDNKPALVQVMARRQAITWTNDDPVQWRIYAALGGRWVNLVQTNGSHET